MIESSDKIDQISEIKPQATKTQTDLDIEIQKVK